MRGRPTVFPVWQLEPQVLKALPAVLDACAYDRSQPSSGWAVAIWLTLPNDELEGSTPLERLRAGDVGAVLRANTSVVLKSRHVTGT